MQNQKRENLLNLALDATPEERERSENLDVGYDPLERTWELIVRHSGSLAGLTQEGIQVNELLNGYAVLVVPEHLMDQVSDLNQIEYIEKPKRLFFASNMARAASCLSTIQTSSGSGTGGVGAGAGVISGLESGLTGRGVLVAVIDSGIDYFHPDFRNPDGTTRIGLLADQDRDRIYTREEINAALETGS
ncbi:MAG: peptidase S8, partial [Clostridium sp.]|nr:peptidase S8 [Clostridium sp.]